MKLFLAGILVLFSSAYAQPFAPNDVSILHALPSKEEKIDFLIPARGLLPHSVYNSIGKITTGSLDIPADEYSVLRVIGVRVDPCFKFLDRKNCSSQLRLVWQPIKEEENGFSTFDSAIHAFYELKAEEFKALLKDLSALKKQMALKGVITDNLTLQVHPAFHSKDRASFAKEVKKLVMKYASQRKLIRVTFMKLFTPDIWWVFGGLEIRKNGNEVIKITRQSDHGDVQNFFNDEFTDPKGMKGSIVPELSREVVDDNLSEFLHGYTKVFSTQEDKEKVRAALKTAERIENPAFFTPETLDCVHCHVTSAMRAWINSHNPELYKKLAGNFPGKASISGTKSLRMFGYQGKNVSISHRVVNETAEVVQSLNLTR